MKEHTSLISARDYQRIERAITWLAREYQTRPSLEQMARAANLSKAHFNRLFRHWAGITPKQFVQHLTLNAAKVALRETTSILQTTLLTGLSSSSRLHDLFITLEAVTPGEFKTGGANMQLHYGFASTPFGQALLAWNQRGLSHLHFTNPTHAAQRQAVDDLCIQWFGAQLQQDDTTARIWVERIWAHDTSTQPRTDTPLRLYVRGTHFQIKVWRALLAANTQSLLTYKQLAAAINAPRAARAVGSAVGANPIAWLIPCHRVLRAHGGLGGYRWGLERKRAVLVWEHAQHLKETLIKSS